MEEKKQIKISLKTCIIGICVIILLIIGGIIYYFNTNKCSEYNGNYQKVSYINEEDFSNSNFKNMIDSSESYLIINDYSTYNNILKNVENCWYSKGTNDNKFNSNFFSNNSLLAVDCCAIGKPNLDTELMSFTENGNVANVKIYWHSSGVTADISGDIYFIPVSKNIKSAKIEYEYPKTKNTRPSLDKPIIYLYPTEDTEVCVKLLKDENLTCSYPKYKDEWKVLAQSNGNLKDLATNRQLYSLYYESKSDIEFKVENEGFIVKGEDTIAFLEEKLAVLGLTEKEAEEFIVYWLPKLEANKYNYIRFATIDEINENMPLEINPNPDTIIRVLMTFKGLENPIDVQEQKLEKPNRTGFVAVEWGGTEIEK